MELKFIIIDYEGVWYIVNKINKLIELNKLKSDLKILIYFQIIT